MKETVLFLPILQSQAEALRDTKGSITNLIEQWETEQLASVVVIQNLPSLNGRPKRDSLIEAGLAEMIAIGVALSERSPQESFASLVSKKFNRASYEQGLSLMTTLGIRFLDRSSLERKEYLTPQGHWDRRFTGSHTKAVNPLKHEFYTAKSSFYLTDQQARAFRTLHAEQDESLHIEGRAGTGKTHLITCLVESLKASKPLLLAYTAVQLRALMDRLASVNTSLKGSTFGELAKERLESDPRYRKPGKRALPRHQVSPREVAARLGFLPIGKLSPAQVASMCAQAVAAFCQTNDLEIGHQHIPRRIVLSAVDQSVFLQYANELWRQTIEPTSPEYELPLRGYHRIKHMTLSREAIIPGDYTHIIVDEAHDLPKPLASFLDRCHLPIITLGDSFQRLDGSYFERSGALRKHEIYTSVRAGRQIESVINPLIEKHPIIRSGFIEGNTSFDTRVTYYDRPEIPSGRVTILVDSEWGLFEWFQRLGHAGAKFSLLQGAVSSFRLFITECISLYHEGRRPTHSALYRFASWSSLQAEMANNQTFERIERMLSLNYQVEDFERSLASLDLTGEAPLKLGRVVDARNSEIDSVMLAPDLLGDIASGDRLAASLAFSALYTGGTRAKYRLIVPGYLRDWASDVSNIVEY